MLYHGNTIMISTLFLRVPFIKKMYARQDTHRRNQIKNNQCEKWAEFSSFFSMYKISFLM